MSSNNALRHAKRVIVGVVGITIVLIGLALLVLPGPGLIVVIIGLGILATEFVWARSLLEKAKHHYHKTKHKITGKGPKQDTVTTKIIERSK